MVTNRRLFCRHADLFKNVSCREALKIPIRSVFEDIIISHGLHLVLEKQCDKVSLFLSDKIRKTVFAVFLIFTDTQRLLVMV